MRIYEGSPRQQWEEVLRSIGAFADREQLKELLLLELEVGFVLQGLGLQSGGADSDSFGTAVKRTYELTDDQVAELMDVAVAQRGTAPDSVPHAEITNYYEHAMRVLGSYIDSQKAHDVFLFEQEGSFVLRLFGVCGIARSPPARRIHARRDLGYDRVRARAATAASAKAHRRALAGSSHEGDQSLAHCHRRRPRRDDHRPAHRPRGPVRVAEAHRRGR